LLPIHADARRWRTPRTEDPNPNERWDLRLANRAPGVYRRPSAVENAVGPGPTK
jgi:hypothetical protein